MPGQKPNQFWSFYPTQEVWQTEFETKWEPDFLPRGEYKNHPVFGWKPTYDKGLIKKIEFNSGVTIYCKTYAQKIKDLQSGSVHAIFLDEEPPVEFIPELQARLRATNGYFNGVMTPTLGQEYWRRVFEPKNPEEEIFPDADKETVSLYDCQTYEDGTKTKWTDQRIQEIIAECPTQADVLRRVWGRFVKSEGLRFESFDLDRNTMSPQPVPRNWQIYAAVDPGSGGKSGHPAAIVFIAVRPDFKEGWVFKAWRGDGIPTANPDILDKYQEMAQGLLVVSKVYDYKDKDFQLVALARGEAFEKANKARDDGFGLVNSLLKLGVLKVFRGDVETEKLIAEFMAVPITNDKRKLLDDLTDAVRYDCMQVPWDLTGLDVKANFQDPPPDQRTLEQIQADERLQARRDFVLNKNQNFDDSLEAEFEYINELSGAGNE